MPNTLAIIGAGRVGRALGRRLREVGWKIGAVVTRGEPSAGRAVRFIGAGNACAGLTRQVLSSQVILITTPDDEIASAARELARIGEEELRGRIVLHTSGAMDSSALQAVQERGATVGSMHPLQSFSGVTVPSLEGKVFAIVVSLGMKRSEAVRALLPLTRQVLDNFERLGPRAAWTGPLSRGDFKVVRAHLEALRESPEEFAHAYAALSRLAARVLSQDTSGMLAELEKDFFAKNSKAKVTGGCA